MSRTSTGRGKRKYYLSKYLQFLIPYTKTRLKHHTPSSMMALRKFSSTSHLSGLGEASQTPSQTPLPTPPPMTCINHMPLPIVSSDDTKDSTSSDVAAIAEEDVVVSLVDPVAQQHRQQQQQQQQQQQEEQQEMLYHTNHNNLNNLMNNNYNNNNNNNNILSNHSSNNQTSKSNSFYNHHYQNATLTLQQHIQQQHQPMRLPVIKTEPGSTPPPLNYSQNLALEKHQITSSNNNFNGSPSNTNNNNNNNNNNSNNNFTPPVAANSSTRATISSSTAVATVDLGQFADWIKNKNALSQQQRQYSNTVATPPDADQSFLNSLHPYLKEMSGKQNRRFRQKVVALVDAILDNAD